MKKEEDGCIGGPFLQLEFGRRRAALTYQRTKPTGEWFFRLDDVFTFSFRDGKMSRK